MFQPERYRPYQLDAIYSIVNYFDRHSGNPLLALPGGSGKSWVIGGFIHLACSWFPNQRILKLTHDSTLIEQNMEKLLMIWPTAPAGIFCDDLKRKDTHCQITYASIQSIAKHAAAFGHIDLVLIDEAHLVSHKDETQYRKFLAALLKVNPYLKVIGFTATPYRLGLGMLTSGGLFTDTCYDLCTPEGYAMLIRNGWLSPLISRATDYTIDISGVRTQGVGEFVEKELQAATDQDEKTWAVVQECVRKAWDRERWLMFAVGIKHAERLTYMLNYAGIPSVVIHSKLDPKTYDRNFKAFKTGAVRAAVNMNGMTTGVDIPEIDFIGILRHSNSAALWVQILSRGTRPAPWRAKINCLVLDFTTNTARLGPIDDPQIPLPPGKKKKGGEPIVKQCQNPLCKAWCHPSVRYCGGSPEPSPKGCGYEFVFEVKIEKFAGGLDVMRLKPQADPIVELLKVDTITYRATNPRSGVPALQVTYYCGLQRYMKWICLEHEKARTHAARWWNDHFRPPPGQPSFVPETAAAAEKLTRWLRAPSHIRVWTNQKPKPEIIGYVYE